MNVIAMSGRIATEIESSVANESTITKFRIAVPNPKGADFFNVVVWGKQAEAVRDNLTKGRRINITGRLSQNTWEHEGQKREKVEIVASLVEFGEKPQPKPQDALSAPEPATVTPTVESTQWVPKAGDNLQLGF